jgi:hypothetical protein
MKKNIALVILIIMALVMFGCSSNEKKYVENNPDSSSSSSNAWLSGLITRVPVLFGVGGGPLAGDQVRSKGGIGGSSSLYWINTITGSATVIGDTGYCVEGIAYDAITNKLYGITSSLFRQAGGSQLIQIDMATGVGSLIGTITPGEDYFSNPTFNSLGTLYAVNNYRNQLCTINLTTAEAVCFGNAVADYKPALEDDDDDFGPLNLKNRGLAFNNIDILNLIVPDLVKGEYKDDDDSSGDARIYTFNADHMKFDYQRTIHGLPYGMAPNGDFDPVTGIYWGLDSLSLGNDDDDSSGSGKNVLVIDINNGTLIQTIPTLDNLYAITFGYLDASTLIKMGLNDLINFLCPKTPE